MTAPLQAEHRYAKSEAMPTDELPSRPSAKDPNSDSPAEKRPLTPAAERALAEAAARRAAENREDSPKPKEISGRDGPEPTRYGDWEINGLASDF
jgi:hypothetical protein